MNATPFPGLPTKQANPFTGRSPLRDQALVEVEAWTFDDRGEVIELEESTKPKPTPLGVSFNAQDQTLLAFMIRHRYISTEIAARLLDRTPKSARDRLNTLRRRGLVQGRAWGTKARNLWAAADAAYGILGSPLKPFNLDTITGVLIAHTIEVSAVAAELEREYEDSRDVLGLATRGEAFPTRNRTKLQAWSQGDDEPTWGEVTVGENELKRAYGFAQHVSSFVDLRQEAREAAQLTTGEAPELLEENAHLFVVYGEGGKAGFHIPDLVVARPRGEHGEPRSIAVEIERNGKSEQSWRRILRSYRDHGGLFARVVYLTPSAAVARGLKKADQDEGLKLIESGRLSIGRLVTQDI